MLRVDRLLIIRRIKKRNTKVKYRIALNHTPVIYDGRKASKPLPHWVPWRRL